MLCSTIQMIGLLKRFDLKVALYVTAIIALVLFLRPFHEGMKGKKGNQGKKGKGMMMAQKKKRDDDDDDDDDEKRLYDTPQQLLAAVKTFLESKPQGAMRAEVDVKDKKKNGIFLVVKVKGGGAHFRGRVRVQTNQALAASRNAFVQLFTSPQFASRIDARDTGFKVGATLYDTHAAMLQSAGAALAGAKAQGAIAAGVALNKKWDGTADYLHITVFGRKSNAEKAAFFFRGYARFTNNADFIAAFQAVQKVVAGVKDAKFRVQITGNKMRSAGHPGTHTLTPSMTPSLTPSLTPSIIPPTVSLPPMSTQDPLATMPPLVTADPMITLSPDMSFLSMPELTM